MDDSTNPTSRRRRTLIGAAGLLTAGALAGGVLAGTLSANAASTSGTSSLSESSSTDHPEHGTQAHESAEKAVTGANADKAKAAAVKSVGSGTAGDVTADMTGKGYEVTVTKADGSTTEVHLDSAFAAMADGH